MKFPIHLSQHSSTNFIIMSTAGHYLDTKVLLQKTNNLSDCYEPRGKDYKKAATQQERKRELSCCIPVINEAGEQLSGRSQIVVKTKGKGIQTMIQCDGYRSFFKKMERFSQNNIYTEKEN